MSLSIQEIEEASANNDVGFTTNFTDGKFTVSLVDLRYDTVIVSATSFVLASTIVALGQALDKIKGA